MTDYFFTSKQTDQIEAAYSKITLAKTGFEAISAKDALVKVLNALIVGNMEDMRAEREDV